MYAQVVLDSRKQWRAEHADYQKTYWRTHPEAAARNRQRQRQLDRQRRVTSLGKEQPSPVRQKSCNALPEDFAGQFVWDRLGYC